jgi:S1-C subfamily serine protease
MLVSALSLSACGDEADPAVAVHRLDIGRCSSADRLVASAALVEDDLLVTVAHSFDAADELVVDDADGNRVDAHIVYLDRPRDIALLRLDRPASTRPLQLTDPPESGSVSVTTAAGDGWPNDKEAEVVDLVGVTMDGEGRRAAIKLAADIKPGDSGAPVVDDGSMVGMIFATSRNSDIGWAVAAEEILAAIDRLEADGPQPVDLTC